MGFKLIIQGLRLQTPRLHSHGIFVEKCAPSELHQQMSITMMGLLSPRLPLIRLRENVLERRFPILKERKAPHSLFDRPELLSSQIDGEIWTVERWIFEASVYRGECPRCSHETRGKYIPVDRYGDCGIVEGCQICSWEVVRVRGLHRVPIEWRS